MKRLNRIFICLLFVFTTVISLSACRDPYIESGTGSTTCDGVSLRVESIDYSGDFIKLNAELRNDTLYEITYGAEYVVERYVDGDWINCMRADISFIEIAYVLSPLGTSEKSYSLQYADISKEGQYRIRIGCNVHKQDEVEFCSLTANFTVDSGFTLAGYHRVEYILAADLVDEPKPYYKAGDTVTLKIYKIMDLGFELYVNGEELKMEEEGDEYWQYSFTMPDAPVKITSRTYDGFTE